MCLLGATLLLQAVRPEAEAMLLQRAWDRRPPAGDPGRGDRSEKAGSALAPTPVRLGLRLAPDYRVMSRFTPPGRLALWRPAPGRHAGRATTDNVPYG